MVTDRTWAAYPATYRAKEMKLLARWIAFGESGLVVGLPGAGRSNLLGFLCYRSEVWQSYLPSRAKPAALIPVDLNDLPADDLGTLYRVILRSFFRVQDQFEGALGEQITKIYQANQVQEDPFISQSALQDILLLFQQKQMRVVLVLNHFDYFCEAATPRMVNTLRGLRDNFKDSLCYIAGMLQEVAYLPDPTILGEMYELLDSHICWVGMMTDDDARNLIDRATYMASEPPTEADITIMLALTGGFPYLLRIVCYWWLNTLDRPAYPEWKTVLFAERSIQYRLAKIWDSLTQEEQLVLSELQKLQASLSDKFTQKSKLSAGEANKAKKRIGQFAGQHYETLSCLAEKGLCYQTDMGWCIRAELLVMYIATVEGRGSGRIWLNEQTGEVYQGEALLKDLTALEQAVLTFMIKRPRIRHTKTDLIVNAWPDDLRREGVTDNSLYQVIFGVRTKIEPNLSKPTYLINWRGKPEGGYQFFPEGRPG